MKVFKEINFPNIQIGFSLEIYGLCLLVYGDTVASSSSLTSFPHVCVSTEAWICQASLG